MRKFIKIAIAALVLIIGALLVAPFLIPMDVYKKEATDRLTLMLGRKVEIGGALRLKLFPNVAIEVHEVKIGNPPGFSAQPFAMVGTFAMDVPLNALLNKQIIITSLKLKKPVVRLEVNKQGKNNWQIEIQTPKTASLRGGEADAAIQSWACTLDCFAALAMTKEEVSFELISSAHAANTKLNQQSLALKHVEISDGSATLSNAVTGINQTITDVNITAKADTFSKPVHAKGSMVWNGEKVSIEQNAASLRALVDGDETAVQTKIDSNHLKLTFNGTTSANSVKGKLEVGSPSLVKTAKWLQNKMTWSKTALKTALRGDLTYSKAANGFKLENTEIAVDDIRLKGNINISLAGAKPMVVADLQGEALDLSPYTAENSRPRRGWGGVGADLNSANIYTSQASPTPNLPLAEGGISGWFISEAYASAPWTQTPIDWKGLRAFDADVKLKAASLRLAPWDFKNVNLRANVQSGQMALNIASLETFGGAITGVVKLNGAGDRAGFGVNLKGSGVQVEPLLKAVAKNDKITGTAQFTVDVDATGASQAQMMQNLDGNGTISIRDGMVKGVNLAQMARNIRSAFGAAASGAKDSSTNTDFTELGGSYTIKSGIVSNQDLAMKSPYIRLSGKGQVNLPAYTINYRMVPELVDTGKGQGGKDKEGIAVPIVIIGPLDNPSFTPDLASIVQDTLKNPEKLKENIATVKDAIKNNKGDIKQQLKDTKQLLKGGDIGGLLGGFGKKQEPAPASATPAPTQ